MERVTGKRRYSTQNVINCVYKQAEFYITFRSFARKICPYVAGIQSSPIRTVPSALELPQIMHL